MSDSACPDFGMNLKKNRGGLAERAERASPENEMNLQKNRGGLFFDFSSAAQMNKMFFFFFQDAFVS